MDPSRKRPQPAPSAFPWKRGLLIAACFGLIAVRWFWPSVPVDTTTLWLVVIAAILFLAPDLKDLTPYIKRIRIGDAELELKEKIEELAPEVQRARDAAAAKADPSAPRESAEAAARDIDKVLEESSVDPRAALLLVSSKIEQQLHNRLTEAGVPVGRNPSAIRSVEIGVREGVFPKEFLNAFRDFWVVRNQVIHSTVFNVSSAYLLSLVSLGTELLKALSNKFVRRSEPPKPALPPQGTAASS